MPKTALQIGTTAVLILALISSLYVLLFSGTSSNAGIVTVIGFLIGGLLILTFGDQLSKFKIGPVSGELRQLTKRIDEQQEMINALRTALEGVITKYEYEKLEHLARDGAFPCWFHDNLGAEMKQLYDHGFVEETDLGSGPLLDSRRNTGQEFDLKEHFVITDRGRSYLQCRHEWQVTPSNKAEPKSG